MAPTSSTQDVLNELEAFLGAATTSRIDAEQLLRYVRDRPETSVAESALPTDEMEERLDFANRAVDAMNERAPLVDRHLTKFEMSVVCSLPLDQLRALERAFHREVPMTFGSFSSQAEELVRVFLLRGNRSNTTEATASRDKGQAETCLERDGNRCIVTGTMNPEVCHVVPFSANSSAEKRKTLENKVNVLESVVGGRAALLLGEPGSSDRSWNMICLNRQLHAWWGRGCFAFKCLSVTPAAAAAVADSSDSSQRSIVKLQFHWMPQQPVGEATLSHWAQNVPNDGRREWVRDWEQRPRYGGAENGDNDNNDNNNDDDEAATASSRGVVAVAHAITSRLVQTGHVVNITMPSMEDGRRMKAMIDIQWACIRMASMSGAAGDPEFIRRHRDELELDSDGADSWIGDDWYEDVLDRWFACSGPSTTIDKPGRRVRQQTHGCAARRLQGRVK